MALKGLVIYFDGPDGAGKTTQLQMAAAKLQTAGHEVYAIHALGGSAIGDKLATAMMAPDPRPPETDLYIALAAQYAALQDIEARRNANQIVLIDRSPLSIIAYQVFAGGIDPEKGYSAATEILERVKPDLLLMYNASPDVLLGRRHQRNQQSGSDYFESMPPAYHEETIKGYVEAASRLGATLINGEGPIEAVHADTMAHIEVLLKA